MNDQIEEKEKLLTINDIFNVLYKSSLLGGIILSILYFTFYANALPSIDNISQLSSYLIAVFGVAFFFILYFTLTVIVPSIIIIDKNFDGNTNHVLWHFGAISLFIILFGCLPSEYSWHVLLIFILPIPIQLLLNTFNNGDCNQFTFYYVYIPIFSYSISNLIFTTIFIAATGPTQILVPLIIFQMMFIGAILIVLFSLSFFFKASNKPNLIITAPFTILKLGYYRAELHFKEDFINKHPFPNNETNQTFNTFFVLSSVGDEYIFCESDTNKTCNDSNTTQPTYRIKKENVEFEVVGQTINGQSTKWENNLTQMSQP